MRAPNLMLSKESLSEDMTFPLVQKIPSRQKEENNLYLRSCFTSF